MLCDFWLWLDKTIHLFSHPTTFLLRDICLAASPGPGQIWVLKRNEYQPASSAVCSGPLVSSYIVASTTKYMYSRHQKTFRTVVTKCLHNEKH